MWFCISKELHSTGWFSFKTCVPGDLRARPGGIQDEAEVVLIALVWCWEMVPLSLWASQTPRGPQRWVWLGGKGCHGKGHCCALRAGLRCREPGAGAARDFLRSLPCLAICPSVLRGDNAGTRVAWPRRATPRVSYKGQAPEERPSSETPNPGQVLWEGHLGYS